MAKRKLTEIESAQTASGQTPYINEIKFNKNAPIDIIGHILHKGQMTRVHWDPLTGECKAGSHQLDEHKMIFTSTVN